jgi:hypothetical protein
MLLILNKYFFKPIFEKKGSVSPNHSIGAMCFVEEESKILFKTPSLLCRGALTPTHKGQG